MKLKVRGTFLLGAMVSITLMTGCASLLVRSEGGIPGTVYPATSFDGAFAWQAGVKGEPLFSQGPLAESESSDSNATSPTRTGFIGSTLFFLGGLIDLPFSLVTDTLFLPFDLFNLSREKSEPDGP